MLGLIWVQTVDTLRAFLNISFLKGLTLKNIQQTNNVKGLLSLSCLNSLPVTCNDWFGRLLISVAHRLDPDQAQQNVGSNLGSNCLTR